MGWAAGAVLVFSCIGQSAFAISSAVNLSTRMVVQTGDNVLIGGFIVYGSGQKKIAVRAMGPSLPLAGKLSDPLVELHDATGNIVASNDNWRSTQEAAITTAGLAPTNDLESALIATINPGAYTVVVKGANNATGIGLMEIYDLDPDGSPARLANISTRGNVLAGDNVMIGGFIITGNIPKSVVLRGLGPSLSRFGITDLLLDPVLELRGQSGNLIFRNDNWKDTQQAQIQATGLQPTDDRESAIVTTLPPTAYTVILTGKNGTTGIGAVEVYDNNQAVDSQLANISTRGFVQTQDKVMIGGFTLGVTNNPTRIAVRGLGPSLTQSGLSNVLADPTLELRDANGTLLIANDDWQSDPVSAGQLSANGLALPNPKEAGIFTLLPAGQFTAILAGKNGGIGIGLVEIYNLR